MQIVGNLAGRAHDLEDVAVASRRYEPDARALALDNQIGDQGRALDEVGDLPGVQPGFRERLEDALLGRVRGGQDLEALEAPGLLVVDDDVREGPPTSIPNRFIAGRYYRRSF